MKQYAALRVFSDNYKLYDGKGNIILSGGLSESSYVYEQSIPLNILSSKGWKVEYPIEYKWFMMSKNVE